MTQETPIRAGPPAGQGTAKAPGPAIAAAPAGARAVRPAQRVARRRPGPAPKRRRAGVLVYSLLALGCLALALAAFLLIASPVDFVKERLALHVKERTGRSLSVRGGTSVSFFPSLGVALHDVELSPPPGMTGPGTRAQAIDARIAWRPLLQQQLVIEAVTVRRPVIELAVDAEGRRSWDFALLGDFLPPQAVQLAQAGQRPGFAQDVPPEMFEALKRSAAKPDRRDGRSARTDAVALAEVRIEDGTVRYSDARNGAKYEAGGVNLRAAISEPASPLKVHGTLVLDGEKVSLDGRLDPAAAAIERRPVKASFKVAARGFDATYDGAFSLADVMALDGRLKASASESGALARWFGPAGTGLAGGMAVDGTIRAQAQVVELTDATITLAGVTATGSIGIEKGRRKPFVKADLHLAELDFDRLSSVRPHAERKREGPPKNGANAKTIGDLLKDAESADVPPSERAQPQVRGFLRRAGGSWSTEPIHLAVLDTLNLDGRFQIGRTVWRELEFGASLVFVTLEGGRLRANIQEAELYDGRGRGVLTVEADGPNAAISLNASVGNVAAGPLMKDLAEFDWVEGRGGLSLSLTGQGKTEREIVESLAGQAEFKVVEGAVVGWDVTRSLRELRQGKLPDLDRNLAKKTTFRELSGTMSIDAGVATNRDLKLTGQPVNLSGEGTIALPDRTVDYTVHPKLASPASAGGTAIDLSGVEVPVHIRGPWMKPVYSADVSSVLKDPRTAEKLQQLGRQVRSGNVDEAIKGVLGDGPEAEKKAAKAKELLKRFMKP